MSTLNLPPSGSGALSNGSGALHKMPSTSSIGMDDDEPVAFDSPNEEAAYYREKYRRIAEMLNETRAELDEFQMSSRELEEELERELATTEKQQEELREKIKRLEAEKDEWKMKHINLQKMHSSTVTNMQREMDNLRSERDKTLVALRDLEMGNDELERNERVAVSSLLDLESKYNRAIEEKTLLEQEVVDRQQLEEQVQRLADELRDANSEISYLKDRLSRTLPTPPSSNARMRATDDKLNKMPRRNVSAPMPLNKRAQTPTAGTLPSARPARVNQLAGANMVTPAMADKSLLTPSSWVILDDDDMPPGPAREDMAHTPSPLERRQPGGQRAVSAASKTSTKTLPLRPGIPSPLTNLSRSTTASSITASSTRPRSRASILPADPNSLSMIRGPSSAGATLRNMMRSPSPANALNLGQSRSRQPSQTGPSPHVALGRGPPPSSRPAPALSVSMSQPSPMVRRSRRSSVGPDLLPTAIPGPKATLSRPVSVPVFDHNTPPPPVPRIPSLHLREKERERAERGRPKTPA
ncbi:NADH:ubiquinone oxidoreductase [Cryptotrichosporon argae]